jgi:integrase
LRRILNVAVETDHLVKNPCKGVKPPEIPQQEMQFLTASEVRDLAEAMPEWCQTWVYFAAETGLRWGEMLGVRRRDLDLLRREVHVVQQITEVQSVLQPTSRPKTKAGKRTVDLSPFLCELLMRQLERALSGPNGLVFVNTAGKTPHASSFHSGVWTKAKRKAGLELRCHDLRHTALAFAVEQGAHALAIKERLGHGTIEVALDRYGHLFPQLGEAIAAGLDRTFRDVQVAGTASSQPAAIGLRKKNRRELR